jgi:hypothetical protein
MPQVGNRECTPNWNPSGAVPSGAKRRIESYRRRIDYVPTHPMLYWKAEREIDKPIIEKWGPVRHCLCQRSVEQIRIIRERIVQIRRNEVKYGWVFDPVMNNGIAVGALLNMFSKNVV